MLMEGHKKEKQYGSYEIGQRIASFRREEQMTQEELAKGLSELLGEEISRSAVKGWENGNRTINSTHIVAIADFFQKTTDEILFGNQPENRDISEYTGLSEDAIENLHWYRSDPEGRIYSIYFNKLIEDDVLRDLAAYLIKIRYYGIMLEKSLPKVEDINSSCVTYYNQLRVELFGLTKYMESIADDYFNTEEVIEKANKILKNHKIGSDFAALFLLDEKEEKETVEDFQKRMSEILFSEPGFHYSE